jgi:secondary thiamine-phosphate synthase enzyme
MMTLKTFSFSTAGESDIIDITGDLEEAVRESGVREGLACAFVPGSTAALTTIEAEPGVMSDLKRCIERIAPKDIHYAHDARWGDGNGYSHVRAALVGPSLAIPVSQGRLMLGTWQQAVLLDFDNRSRDRKIICRIIGE